MIERIKNDKLLLYLGGLILAVFFTLVLRITYTSKEMKQNDASEENSTLSSEFIDEFNFLNEEVLKLSSYKEEKKVAINPKVTLKSSNEITHSYFLYLNFSKNDFSYQNEEKNPLVILNVYKESEEVTDIEGLSYVKINDELSGFDVTTLQDTITVAKNIDINSNNMEETIHDWQFTLTYLGEKNDYPGNTIRADAEIKKNDLHLHK